jgi:predicted DNA-binding antitoxin AbrB/MazE fold protein
MKTIHAIFEQGIFRPLEAVELADQTEVEFEPKVVGLKAPKPSDMDDIYAVLSERFQSGEHDVAERHNEHQP